MNAEDAQAVRHLQGHGQLTDREGCQLPAHGFSIPGQALHPAGFGLQGGAVGRELAGGHAQTGSPVAVAGGQQGLVQVVRAAVQAGHAGQVQMKGARFPRLNAVRHLGQGCKEFVGHRLVVLLVGPQGHGLLAAGEGCLKRFPDACLIGLRRAVQHARPAFAAVADDQWLSLQFGTAAQFRLGRQVGDQQAADGFCGRMHGSLGSMGQRGFVNMSILILE